MPHQPVVIHHTPATYRYTCMGKIRATGEGKEQGKDGEEAEGVPKPCRWRYTRCAQCSFHLLHIEA